MNRMTNTAQKPWHKRKFRDQGAYEGQQDDLQRRETIKPEKEDRGKGRQANRRENSHSTVGASGVAATLMTYASVGVAGVSVAVTLTPLTVGEVPEAWLAL